MSGYATPTTPTNGAGPQRNSRLSRRRVVSDSAVTTSSASGPRRTLLADMPEPSISDLHSSKAPSSINFDSITQHFRSQWRSTPQSSSPSSPLTPQYHSTTAEPLSQGRGSARDPPMTPFVFTIGPEKEHLHERKASIKRLFSSVSSRLDPRKLSRRRPSETSVESDQTVVPHDLPVIDIERPLSLTFDEDTQRFTGLEAWDTLFPHETRDPFAGLGVPVPHTEDISPLSPAQQRQALTSRIIQKLESLTSGAKSRLPKIKFMITPLKAPPPPSEELHAISSPFGFVHRMEVTEDPQTGRLLGLPEEWQLPPATRTGHSSISSLSVPPSHTSRRESMPAAPRNRSQSGTTSSSDEPRATQAAPLSASHHSTVPQGRRRQTRSFSGHMSSARAAYPSLAPPIADRRPVVESRSSSQERPPPLPEKDPPRERRVGPLASHPTAHPSQGTDTLAPQASTSRTPHLPEFPQRTQFKPTIESSHSFQKPQTSPRTVSFGQARYAVRSPHAAYRYL